MTASPFWKGVMRVTGIFCIVTLMLPTVYYVKYVAVDYPAERAIAKSPAPPVKSDIAPEVLRVQQYITVATKSPVAGERSWAVASLEGLLKIPHVQMKYPLECLNAKLTISSVAQSDKDSKVKAEATAAYARIAQGGLVLQR